MQNSKMLMKDFRILKIEIIRKFKLIDQIKKTEKTKEFNFMIKYKIMKTLKDIILLKKLLKKKNKFIWQKLKKKLNNNQLKK